MNQDLWNLKQLPKGLLYSITRRIVSFRSSSWTDQM